jgi:DNA-directed RNA polymerase subunit RPC12/RpoP
MVKLRCPHCGYEWDYKGKSMFYATCPRCMYKVNIKKHRVE